MNEVSIAEQLSLLFQNALLELFGNISSIAISTVGFFKIPALTLYFTYIGINWMAGNVEKGKKNFTRLFILAPLFLYLALDYSAYLTMLSIPIETIRDYWVSEIIGINDSAKGGSTFSLLDATIIQTFVFVKDELFELSNLYTWFAGGAILILNTLLYVQAVYLFTKGLFASSLFLMIGSITLFLFLFDQTKHITSNWFKALMSYVLYAPLTAIHVHFIEYITLNYSKDLSTDINSLFLIVVAPGLMILLLKDVPEYANALMTTMTGGADAGGAGFQWGKTGIGAGANVIKRFRGK